MERDEADDALVPASVGHRSFRSPKRSLSERDDWSGMSGVCRRGTPGESLGSWCSTWSGLGFGFGFGLGLGLGLGIGLGLGGAPS